MALPATTLALLLSAVLTATAEPSGTPGPAPTETPGRPVRLHVVGGFCGVGGSDVEGEKTWALDVTFEQELSDYFSAEFGYFNEGHPDPAGHRDGFSLQLFANIFPFATFAASDTTACLADRVRLRAGAGPTITFDSDGTESGPEEKAGAGFKFTGAVDVRIAGGLSIGPRVEEQVGFGSQNALVIGLDFNYELFPAPEHVQPAYAVVAASGRSMRNAVGGAGVPAYVAVERHELFGWEHLGASAVFLAINGPNDRLGVAVGPEVEERLGQRGDLALGFGLAPYFYNDGEESGQTSSGVAALIKTSASYRIVDRWKLVGIFIRQAGTPEQQNYDVFLGGVGFDFDLPRRADADDSP